MFVPIVNKLRHLRLRNLTRRKLEQMDDWLLRDIGTERDSIGDFISRKADEHRAASLRETKRPPAEPAGGLRLRERNFRAARCRRR